LGSNVTTNPPRLVFGEQLGRRKARAPQSRQRIALGFAVAAIGSMKMRRVMATMRLSSSSVNQFAQDSAVISRSANPG
jgi:hypothetical protein